MNESKTWMKVILTIAILFLILLPLAILILVQFMPPMEAPAQNETGITDSTETGSVTVRTRQARRESRAVKQETTVMEIEPDQNFEGVGAVVPNAPRSKQATPYPPGMVPGDSGIVPQLAEPPDFVDEFSPPDDPWGGAVLPPMTPEQMRGIDGVRRIDPNDPFFQQDIPNPFAN